MGGFRDTAIHDHDPLTKIANLGVEVDVLRAEVERLRAVEAAARVVCADDHQMRSVHRHWEALYEALGVPRGTEAERWAAGQAGR